MEESGSQEEDEGVYFTIPRGGPIYVPNLVGPLTSVPHFESQVFNQLQGLKDLLSQPCNDHDDDLDISVDELKIFTEEELVDLAMKEAFKEGDDDAQNGLEGSSEQCNGGGNDPKSSNISPEREHGAIVPIESSNGIPSRNGGRKAPSKRVPKNTKKSIVLSKPVPRKRKKTGPADDEPYIAKVKQLAKIKEKQEEEKTTVKLHSFSATCKINDDAVSSLERTERMKSLRSTNTAVKVKSSSFNEHLTVPYPEVLLCVEVYHSRRTALKTQEFLVLGQQFLTELRDVINCSTDNMMRKAEQHDPSGYFLIEDSFYNDTRDPLAIDYSEPILDWLKNSKEDALKKWECITSGQLHKKQKEIIGDAPDLHLPRFKAHKMHKTRFCDLRFRLGAGYLYCHQGDCKHTIVIRDMRLINEEDVNKRAAYPIRLFQIKLRIQKCSVCKITRAEKVTVDDKWALENPCYFCKNCYFLLHYDLHGSLLYTDFSVYDYQHD